MESFFPLWSPHSLALRASRSSPSSGLAGPGPEIKEKSAKLNNKDSLLFGRRCLVRRSEKTELARPRREQRKWKKAGERASGCSRKNAALSRLVTKQVLAPLARARKFAAKFETRDSKDFAEGRETQNRKRMRKISEIVRTRRKEKRAKNVLPLFANTKLANIPRETFLKVRPKWLGKLFGKH